MKLKINEFSKIIGFMIVILVVLYILFPWSKKNTEHFAAPVYVQTTQSNSTLGTPSVPTLSSTQLNSNQFNALNTQFQSLFEYLYNTKQYSDEFKRKIDGLKAIIENPDNQLIKIDDYRTLIKELKKLINEDSKSQIQIGGYLLRKITQKTYIDDLNDEIDQLNKNINEAINKGSMTNFANQTPSPQNPKSIKCIGSGVALNIKVLDDKGPEGQNRILIFINNGCVTYDKTKEQHKDKYFVKICSLNNDKQVFQINEDPHKSVYKVIQPITDNSVCLAVDLNGISLENVNDGKMEHKWQTLQNDIPLCNKYEAEKISLI